MKNAPLLRHAIIKADWDASVSLNFSVYAGLNFLRGNQLPYFSITFSSSRLGAPMQDQSGGAGGENIIKVFPDLADLVSMHLSDMDGVPMHSEINGWYFLAGALGGLGEQYHFGNSSFTSASPGRCQKVFAEHCRISMTEAQVIMDTVLREYAKDQQLVALAEAASGARVPVKPRQARAKWNEICASMRPRWKAEAESMIAKYRLHVFGAPYGDGKKGSE